MRIIVIGCGRMGAALAQTLGARGHIVTVVDKEPSAFERLGPKFKGQTIAGVGFDRDVLSRAGIERADGLAALATSDETNVVIARIATQIFHVPHVVVRLYDPRKAEVYRRLGLQTINPITWGTNRIAELLCHSQLDTVLSLGDGEVDIVEVEIPLPLVGRTVSDLTVSGEIRVVSITRCGSTFLPTLGAQFQKGDLIHIALLGSSADTLKKLLLLA